MLLLLLLLLQLLDLVDLIKRKKQPKKLVQKQKTSLDSKFLGKSVGRNTFYFCNQIRHSKLNGEFFGDGHLSISDYGRKTKLIAK